MLTRPEFVPVLFGKARPSRAFLKTPENITVAKSLNAQKEKLCQFDIKYVGQSSVTLDA